MWVQTGKEEAPQAPLPCPPRGRRAPNRLHSRLRTSRTLRCTRGAPPLPAATPRGKKKRQLCQLPRARGCCIVWRASSNRAARARLSCRRVEGAAERLGTRIRVPQARVRGARGRREERARAHGRAEARPARARRGVWRAARGVWPVRPARATPRGHRAHFETLEAGRRSARGRAGERAARGTKPRHAAARFAARAGLCAAAGAGVGRAAPGCGRAGGVLADGGAPARGVACSARGGGRVRRGEKEAASTSCCAAERGPRRGSDARRRAAPRLGCPQAHPSPPRRRKSAKDRRAAAAQPSPFSAPI